MKRIHFALVGLLGLGLAADGQAQTTTPPAANASCATVNPIVLATGLSDIDFNGVAEALQACGAKVFKVEVDPSNTSLVRGPQLLDGIKMVLATSGATKVNLIGHSQGGDDSRFVLGMAPELLASITQLGTPNRGSAVADLAAVIGPDAAAGLVGDALMAIGGRTGTDPAAANAFLATQGLAEFNKMFPAGLPEDPLGQGEPVVNGVALFSWGGTSVRTNAADPSDMFLSTGALAFQDQPNDGLVGRNSTHFGKVMRDDLAMNHLDLINQVDGAVGAGEDPLMLYIGQVSLLKGMGL